MLGEVDPDIAAASSRVSALGASYERELAEKYLTLNDKSYLQAIEQQLQAKFAGETKAREELADAHGAALAKSFETEMKKYEELLLSNSGRDPRENARVLKVEPYTGSWKGFEGGIRVTLEDGSIILRQGGVFRRFASAAEVD